MLEEAFGGLSLRLFKHKLKNSKVKKLGKRYDDTVRTFAVTLQYLSTKAYDFVRPVLDLPHPSTLRSWRASVNCQPGFLEEMLKATQRFAGSSDNSICSLIVDEMNLRKEVVWCPSTHQYSGHVDYGGGPVNSTVASNALVFVLVGMKKHWKAPIAYFLTDHVTGEALAENINEAILKAAEYGLLVKTVVADGLSANMKAGRLLGCQLNAVKPEPYFAHPHSHYASEKVYFICDPPHMLKLVRNVMAENGSLYNAEGKEISRRYITQLHQLQEKDSLYLANKLRGRHVNFKNVKMKVRIAAQTLSASVATAIDHLRDDLALPQFKDSEATCEFIRVIDTIFDMLNSKNIHAKGHKAPLGLWNQLSWKPCLQRTMDYLLALRDKKGQFLYSTPRGQAIVGFLITITSAMGLAEDLLTSGRMKYLMTYKFSQDHIEMYFSKIRQRGGWNNNPTAEQFRAAMRTLLLQNSIKASEHANATILDGTQDIQLPWSSMQRARPASQVIETESSEFINAVQNLESALSFADTDWRHSRICMSSSYWTQNQLCPVPCCHYLSEFGGGRSQICLSP